MRKNRLPAVAGGCYRLFAAPQWVAGRRNPCKQLATPDATSVFFIVAASAHPHSAAYGRTVSMVALVGQLSGWPVSNCTGIPTPISVTTHNERRNSGGGSLKPQLEATAMVATPTPSHPQKVILPHVRRLSEEAQSHLDPFRLALYRERRELLCRFKQALEAAGVEYVEADHE
ncbi:ash family protein [Salmonella enterica]|nr:ash family protein [Salmonella enterica]EJH7016129.1 ash family protein [Salmonella enterica]EJH7437814.1 ash family protein [Salmonella enterica]EJH7877109.1 ash family protein [Salmonella enterica]EJH7880979.1 ash family protein [Salmonella enterica]